MAGGRAHADSDSDHCPGRQPLAGLACSAIAVFVALSLHGCGRQNGRGGTGGGTTPEPVECSEVGVDCSKTKCCEDESLKCFQKNTYWAACKASCTPGIDPNDPPGDQTNWTCQELLPGVEPTPPPMPGVPEGWKGGTWTTGYWDCCKPSCSWAGKGKLKTPVRTCNISTGEFLDDPNEKSVCDSGEAASCKQFAPFVVNDGLSMGFAAAAVSGSSGLTGDDNCGQCFELQFIGYKHPDGEWGGAHPDLVGKRMIVQVTNIGVDVTGNHSFDIQVPGAGQGIFDEGCVAQYPGYEKDDFDGGKRYGGMKKKSECRRMPEELREGCEWHFDWLKWMVGAGQTNNPYVNFHRVKCPDQLISISGAVPEDDDEFEVVI